MESQIPQSQLNIDVDEGRSPWIIYGVSIFIACLCIGMAFTLRVPLSFPINQVVHISEGETLDDVATSLAQENVIHSPALFKVFVYLLAGEKRIIAGDYYFQERRPVFSIAHRVVSGEYGLKPVTVTIPEGATVYDIADVLDRKMDPNAFDREEFIRSAESLEGYLFPATYKFLPNVKERVILDEMQRVFAEKVAILEEDIEAFGRPLGEVVIMASLLEKEARTTRSRRIIAGILWKRLEIDMPLQVDAVFPYINGKNTFELTYKDLDIDSPYNTYRYKGLPIGPIANPGLDSLKAAVTPIETDYLFYLSDMDGRMHYAENFEEHKRNKRLHLN